MKKIFISYLLIFAALLGFMGLSKAATEKMRGKSIAVLAPLKEKLLILKQQVLHPFQQPSFSLESLSLKEEKHKLEVDKQLLTQELAEIYKLFYHQQTLQQHISTLATAAPLEAQALMPDYQRALQRLVNNLKLQIQAVPARVLFRSMDTWNHSLWINVGNADNQGLPIKTVAKNSPVLVGQAIVGVIDYVGEHQSRVRLITDSSLVPSVRAMRGGEQEFMLGSQVSGLLDQLQHKKLKNLAAEDLEQLTRLLSKLKTSLQPLKKSWSLAKGELQGCRQPEQRGGSFTLKGTGFNYDFADEEGEARDLRTGQPLHAKETAISLLKVNDILVTTGMDGVFPAGLKVALVTKIHLLKEGDYFYELEAAPLVSDLQELSLVFVIPPVGYER